MAFAAYVPHNYPHDKLEPGLNENAFYDPSNFTFPAGTYVCEVEVDPETGVVKVEKFTAVDDFGKIINPMIVEGQVHGGLTQGIGQALTEGCRYDDASGQLLTGSFMDYCMPRATDVPSYQVDTRETPCSHNPLGVKGCGEAGAIGAPGGADERDHRCARRQGHADARHAAGGVDGPEEQEIGERHARIQIPPSVQRRTPPRRSSRARRSCWPAASRWCRR